MACSYAIAGKDYSLPEFKAYLAEGGLEKLYPDGNYPWEQKEPEKVASLLDSHAAIDKRITEGKITVDEMRAEFEKLATNGEAIMAELSKFTKADLEKRIRTYVRPDAKKADLVEDAYEAMITDYWIGGGTFSYSVNFMGKESPAQAKTKKVRQFLSTLTDEAIQKHADEIKQAKQQAEEERKAVIAGMENPQELNDYYRLMKAKIAEGATYDEARMSLSPEQRTAMDEMAGEKSRDERKARADQQKTDVRATATTTSGDIIETKHTKTGEDLFVVKAADRVERETYNEWNATAKRLGGWYSSYRGSGAVPGFQFKTRENAEAFQQYLGGDVTQAKEAIQERRDAYADDKSQTAVERLAEMADRLEEKGLDSLNQDRKANTARRAGMAARAEANAQADIALAKTMRNIAAAIESGKAKFLDRVRQKAQVEMLQSFVNVAQGDKIRAKYDNYGEQQRHQGEKPDAETADFARYPDYTAYRSDLASLARGLIENDGTKKIGQELLKVADDVDDVYLKWAKENLLSVSRFTVNDKLASFASKQRAGDAAYRSGLLGKAIILTVKRGDNRIILSPSEAMRLGLWKGDNDKRITLSKEFGKELVEKIGKAARRNKQLSVPWQFEYAYDKQKRLSAMGLETKAEFRAALREFIGLSETPKEADKIKEMERAMIGRADDGLDFFPTPASVAEQMVETADIKPGMRVLEPSAGMGHIAEKIRESGVDPEVIELSNSRKELLEAKGFNVVGRDFMDFTDLNQANRSFTFGDVFRNREGKLGVMRGSNGLGGNRVGFYYLDENGRPSETKGSYENYDELEPVERRGVGSGYDRIVMNPPFGDRRDAEHVQHAYDLLKPGGRLVAIMGEGVFFGSDKKAQAFRDWLEERGGTDEKLEEGTFKDPSLPVTTGVNARMVVIDKPMDAATQESSIKYSKGEEKPGSTVEEVKSWLSPRLQRMVDAGKLRIDQSHGNSKVDAYYDPNSDTVVLVADKISKDTLNSVLSHELLHRAESQDPQIKAAIGIFESQLERSFNLAASGKGNAIEKAAYQRVIEAGTPAKDQAEEYRAYMVSEYQRNPDSITGYIKKAFNDLVAAIRVFLVRNGLDMGFIKSLTPADLAAMSKYGSKINNKQTDNFSFGGESKIGELSADIRYSMSSPEWLDKYQGKASTAIADYLSTSKTFNWWHKSVGSQFHKALKDAHFAKVFNRSMQFEQDLAKMANEDADKAPSILPKQSENPLRIPQEIQAGYQRNKDAEKVGSAIFETTLNDKPMTDDELKAQGLSDKQIQMYHEFFATVNSSLDNVGKSEMFRAARALKIPQAPGNLSLKATAEWYAEQAQDAEDAKGFIGKADSINKLKKEGYAPLMRFGQFTVDVVENPGEPNENRVFFGMFETEAEANKMAREIGAEYPEAVVSQGVMSQNDWQMFRGVTPETMEIFANAFGVEQDDAFQKYLKTAVNNRSALKRLIHRKKIKGYEMDVQRVLATFITSNARMASKNYHLGEMVDAVAQIPKHKGDVIDEAVSLYNFVQNPAPQGAMLRNLLFTWYLGGSAASAMVNLSQTFTTTLPFLHQFGNTKQVVGELTIAMKIAANPDKATGDLAKALKMADEEGVTAPHELHMLYGESMRNGMLAPQWLRPIGKAWGSLFSAAEAYNRRVAFIAAYNIAKQNKNADPFAFATDAVNQTQFVYSKSSRPNWARSTVGSTVFTFKMFIINYLEFVSRLPKQEQAIALGVLVMFAGLGGLPGEDDADDVIDTVGQAMGYNTNVKAWKERTLNDMIGKSATNYAMRGLSAALPFDISSRLGVSNVIPGTAIFKKSEKDKSRDVMEFAGAAGSLGARVVEAFDAAQSREGAIKFAGTVGKSLVPKAIQDAYQAADMYQTGQYRDMKGRKVTDTTKSDAIFKLLGLQPNRVADVRRPERLLNQDITLAKEVESDIAAIWAEGVYEKDSDKIAEAKSLLKKWNDRNPETPIGIKMNQIMKRVKQMRQTSEQRMVKTTPKEMRRYAETMLSD